MNQLSQMSVIGNRSVNAGSSVEYGNTHLSPQDSGYGNTHLSLQDSGDRSRRIDPVVFSQV